MAQDGIVVRGLEGLTRWFLGFEGMAAEEFHVAAATYIKAQILRRTAEGIDVNERKFRAYSKAWAKVRRKKGLKTRPVDLFFTGSMLSAMAWKANKEQAVLFFRPSSDKKGAWNPTKAYQNQHGKVKRRFFAMSKKDMDDLVKIYWKVLARKVVGL
jgi:hypothetical protein